MAISLSLEFLFSSSIPFLARQIIIAILQLHPALHAFSSSCFVHPFLNCNRTYFNTRSGFRITEEAGKLIGLILETRRAAGYVTEFYNTTSRVLLHAIDYK